MKIQVLGSGCKTCKTLYKNVQDVVSNLGLNAKVEYSTDIADIVKTGAMKSPAFVIDGNVMVAGRVPSNAEIEKIIMDKRPPENKNVSGGCCCGGNC